MPPVQQTQNLLDTIPHKVKPNMLHVSEKRVGAAIRTYTHVPGRLWITEHSLLPFPQFPCLFLRNGKNRTYF